MYKKIILSKYEMDKCKAYTQGACSRFEVSEKFQIKKLKNIDFLFALSKTVNETQELKRFIINNEVAEFNTLNPAYLLEKNNEIVCTYTDFDDSYDKFYENYKKDYELFLKSELVFCLKQAPQNIFHISSFKKSFETFSLHLKHGFEFYQPIFTSYKKDNELIIYANFHHAFFDLKRARIFFDKLKNQLINTKTIEF